jgi:exopolysaccharide biosynthesis predicted pyruvyltransferase EpsI
MTDAGSPRPDPPGAPARRRPGTADAWADLAAETEEGFAWLCNDIDPSEPVTFVPNPGNIGDALINLSCHQYLARRFDRIRLCSVDEIPQTERVFVAGGGNLVAGLYASVAAFVERHCRDRRLHFFPSSVKGMDRWLDRLSGRLRIVCREPVSFAQVAAHVPAGEVLLGHDAAFRLAPRLRAAFAAGIAAHPPGAARFFRTDGERAHALPTDRDLMAEAGGDWRDLAEAERVVAGAAITLLGFGRIYTDRLHCAILAALLERYVVLMPNSYFKNEAVFGHSLSRFANVRFEPGKTLLPSRA